MNDELDEVNDLIVGTRTLIWDVSDLDDPILVKEHLSENTASDHNLYIVGDLMFQSNYNSGLRVLDISDRENPREVAFFDTVPGPDSPSMNGSWSNYPFFKSGIIDGDFGGRGVLRGEAPWPDPDFTTANTGNGGADEPSRQSKVDMTFCKAGFTFGLRATGRVALACGVLRRRRLPRPRMLAAGRSGDRGAPTSPRPHPASASTWPTSRRPACR